MGLWVNERNETKQRKFAMCACVRACVRVCVCVSGEFVWWVDWLLVCCRLFLVGQTLVGKETMCKTTIAVTCHMWPGPSVSCWTLAFTQTNKLSVPRAGLISQTVGIPWFHEEVGSTLSSKTTKLRDKSQECATAYNMMLAVWRNVSLTLD